MEIKMSTPGNNQLLSSPTDALISYTIHLADTALILGHRNSEWCGHGPVLEQDIAISNIALDLVGQARMFYQYAAELTNSKTGDNSVTEDTLAYLRDTVEFKNLLLVEQANGDWAVTILRQFFCSTWQYYLYSHMQQSTDTQLAGIAAKALKEVTYHLKWSSEWVIRLGDGTEESHRRIHAAVEALWPFTGELFLPETYEEEGVAAGWAVDVAALKQPWQKRVAEVFEEAGLPVPAAGTWFQTGGKKGIHTELMGLLLAEMQFLQRAYPGGEW